MTLRNIFFISLFILTCGYTQAYASQPVPHIRIPLNEYGTSNNGNSEQNSAEISLMAVTFQNMRAGGYFREYFGDYLTYSGSDSDFDVDDVLWQIVSGSPPGGLILSDGMLYGEIGSDQIGSFNFTIRAYYNGKYAERSYTITVLDVDPLYAKSIDAGGNFTCAVTQDDRVKCWGRNTFGSNGDGTTTQSHAPVFVYGSESYTSVSAGGNHACAVTTSGAAMCWGGGASGQLGHGSNSNSSIPVSVTGIPFAISNVSVGSSSSCAVTVNNDLYCWGLNSAGQLGIGNTTQQNTPQRVTALDGAVRSVSVGGSTTCATTTGNEAYCWGAGMMGQLGRGSAMNSTSPLPVIGLPSGVREVAAGGSHACAALLDGTAYCWGWNEDGQLGNGTVSNSLSPVQVAGADTWMKIVAGGISTCGLTTGGGLKCWGNNWYDQLGTGDSESHLVPMQVLGITNGATHISSASGHTCAIHAGVAKCWGDGAYGRLGINDEGEGGRSAPVRVHQD